MKKILLIAACMVSGLGACNNSSHHSVPALVDAGEPHMVYVMNNDAGGNAVLAYTVADDGDLNFLNNYGTNGLGTGTTEVSPITPQDGIDPLASQGSLTITDDKNFLLACNAGSHDISIFRVENDGSLTLKDVEPSGGTQPNSVAVHGSLVYVSNVGDSSNGFQSNISGFEIQSETLVPIAGSTRQLSTAVAQPARVLFDPSGAFLVVSELTTNTLSVYPVNGDGTLGTPVTTASSGAGPFGSTFLTSARLLVAEAQPLGTGSLSSYNLDGSGNLTAISSSVSSTQNATCWVVVTQAENFAYTTNTGSDSVSSYSIDANGSLSLINAQASTVEGAGSGPTDLAVGGHDGEFLYVLNGGKGSITSHKIHGDGSLERIQVITDALPALGAQGMAAR